MKPEESLEKSQLIEDLLLHLGWVEVIQPALAQERRRLQDELTRAVLGAPPITMTPAGAIPITKEQIAGRVAGIDFIEKLLAKILKDGEAAFKKISDNSNSY